MRVAGRQRVHNSGVRRGNAVSGGALGIAVPTAWQVPGMAELPSVADRQSGERQVSLSARGALPLPDHRPSGSFFSRKLRKSSNSRKVRRVENSVESYSRWMSAW